MNGLGDRDRSPTPGDAWEIMETTIEPDATLPSNQSSFATIPATNSFASTADTTITEPERESASSSSHRRSASEDGEDEDSQGDSTSSADPDDLACTEEEYLSDAESLARDMYYHEMQSPEGRARIARLQQQVNHRFAPDHAPAAVDIGFRLMDEAFDSEEGRARVFAIHGEGAILRMARSRNPGHANSSRRGSPPPYETSTTSHEPPTANPVSRALRDVSEVLLNDLNGDDQDLTNNMRRLARRMAQREDVPDDWWMSMGLNSSITRPRRDENEEREERTTSQDDRRQTIGAWRRAREERFPRGDARL